MLWQGQTSCIKMDTPSVVLKVHHGQCSILYGVPMFNIVTHDIIHTHAVRLTLWYLPELSWQRLWWLTALILADQPALHAHCRNPVKPALVAVMQPAPPAAAEAVVVLVEAAVH